MRFKLDENLGTSIQSVFLEHGHDCKTILDERLSGIPDHELIEIAKKEDRVMITMDHDFASTITYPPGSHSGIAVLNLPSRTSLGLLKTLVLDLLVAIKKRPVKGKLWIVEPGRIREHEVE